MPRLIRWARAERPVSVAIWADADPPGRQGAADIARRLLPYVPAIRVVEPPAGLKDLREWVVAGASVAAVRDRILAAPVRRIGLVMRRLRQQVDIREERI